MASELRKKLAEAQDESRNEPTDQSNTIHFVDHETHVALNKELSEKKQLSELSMLKAKVHQLTMINQQLSDDNYRMKRSALGQSLRVRQSELELSFATELSISGRKFDWNTLTFFPEK